MSSRKVTDVMQTPFEHHLRNESGMGLVATMIVVALLGVFALIAAQIAVNERRTAYNDVVHASSFVAADSGTEAAIAWLLEQNRPPSLTNVATGAVVARSHTDMVAQNTQSFGFDVRMRIDPNTGNFMMIPRPGYDPSRYRDFVYDVDGTGRASTEGRSDVSIIATKLNVINYN